MTRSTDKSTEARGREDVPQVISLQNVSKRFSRVEALKGISITIPQGQVIGLLGPNGSGKSTFLKLIAGLHRPTRGVVLVNDHIPGRTSKTTIAYLPEVDHIYPWMTVRRSLQFISSFYADWEHERAERLLEFLALPPRSEEHTSELPPRG